VLHLKGLQGQTVGEKVTGRDVMILKELEGPRGGRAWFAGHGRIVPTQLNHYSILIPYVNDYFKWFGCCGIARIDLNWGWGTRKNAEFLEQRG
jgi:hypothetical protein